MAIQGLRDTGNFVANQRPENWREGILMLYPRSAEAAKAPLTALTSRMKEASTNDPYFHWWEKRMQTRRVALTTNLTAPAAGTVQTIFATGGGFLAFKEGDIFMVESALGSGGSPELMQVAQDPTSNTQCQVVRGVAGTTPATLTVAGAGVNPNIICVGSAYEEGSLAPTGVAFDPTDVYNFTQIFRATTEMTRTAMNTNVRTGNAREQAIKECLEIIGVDMERSFFFGRRHTTSKNGKPLRFANGIYAQLDSANKLAATSNTLKMTQLETWMMQFFAAGSSEKVAFAGNRALLAIQQAVRKNTAYQIFVNEKEYGIKVVKIVSPFGVLVLLSHPLFSQTASGTTGGTDYWGLDAAMFVLDMANIRYRYLKGSDLTFEDELEVPGMDGIKEGYIAECALELNHASTHFFCYNMATGSADS
jgi:hypothetical protein